MGKLLQNYSTVVNLLYPNCMFQAASPACTELETIVLDWLGKAIGLPSQFLAFNESSRGGGVIQVNV